MIMTFTYDKDYRLIRQQKRNLEPTSTDADPDTLREKNRGGYVTTYVYDSEYRLSYIVAPDGTRTPYTYNK